MKQIADSDYYSIEVDPTKNRLYVTVNGFWNDASIAERYIDAMKRATNELKQGFTLLSDVRQMKAPPTAVRQRLADVEQLMADAGLAKSAEILPQSTIAKLSLDRSFKKTQFDKHVFGSRAEAERWLDA